jgi:hypothetical protein
VGFVGHLYNQGLCHELLCLQLETLLLEEPMSEDGMEVAIHLFYFIDGQASLDFFSVYGRGLSGVRLLLFLSFFYRNDYHISLLCVVFCL